YNYMHTPYIHTLSYTTLFRSSGWIFDHQESLTLNCNIQRIVRRLNASLVEDLPDGPDLSTQADSHRVAGFCSADGVECLAQHVGDRKSTRLNSSHQIISYAVF